MTDHRKLIEEARGFIAGSDPKSARTTLIRDLVDALEAAEKSHTPTDDEREALIARLEDEVGYRVRTAVALHKGGHDTEAQVTEGRASVRKIAAGFRRSEVPEPSAEPPGPPVYLAADLWDALGAPTSEFDSYYARNGWADTWANLLGAVRDHFKPKCGHDTDGEPCVLTAGHLPPHYGASDVGRSEPVPVPEPQGEPSKRVLMTHPHDGHGENDTCLDCKPQGEPSDVTIRNHGGWDMALQSKPYPPDLVVEAALTAWNDTGGSDRVAMRAALRAASEAGGEGR